MKNYLLLAFVFLSLSAKSQINIADSTVQVIGYWDRGEKETFDFEYKKERVKGKDTTVTQLVTYKADITIVDSTATSYTIEWKYRDYKITDKNAMAVKLAKLFDGLVVRYKTDEMGAFQEVLNWQDIKKRNEAALKAIQKEAKLPPALVDMINKLSTKEAIESNSIKDILQFHTFFGVALKYGEPIENPTEEDSNVTGEELRSDFKIELDEINNEENNYVVKFWQTFNPEDLNKMLGTIMSQMLGDVMTKDIKDKVTATAMEDYCGAIMHNTGWPLNMYYQRTLEMSNEVILETRSVVIE